MRCFSCGGGISFDFSCTCRQIMGRALDVLDSWSAAMSVVIKPDDARAIRVRSAPFVTPPTVNPVPVINAEITALRREVETLSRQLADKTAETERLHDDVRRAFRDGEADGRKAGLQEADDSRQAALALLETGVETALDRFKTSMAGLENLSLAI